MKPIEIHPLSAIGGCVAAFIAFSLLGMGQQEALAPPPSAGGREPILDSCLPGIRDQSDPTKCLQASSVPTLGMLYPHKVSS